MESEKVYPISEKKLFDLRNRGLVPHSKLAARIFTFGILIISSGLFKSRIRRILFVFSSPLENQYLDALPIVLMEGTIILLLLSTLSLTSYLFFSLIETKFLKLPYGRYPKGVRKLKNPISIKTELVLGVFLGPPMLLLAILILKRGDYAPILNLIEHFHKAILIFGSYCIWISLLCSIINKLKFRLSQRMSKEEIVRESLEGQMSPTTRSMIAKASTEL